MYLVEVVLFWTYHNSIDSLPMLTLATFVVAMCYGGAYGITPAFAADYFGPRDVGSIFGLMMLPWAFAAAFGTLHLRLSAAGERKLHAGPPFYCRNDDGSAHSSDSIATPPQSRTAQRMRRSGAG